MLENVPLFSEYAVLDRVNLKYLIGIVERIRYNGRDYKRPEPLNSPKKKDLSVVMSVYKVVDDDLSIYSTVGKTLRTIPFTDLICEVILKTCGEHLALSRDDQDYLNTLISSRFGCNSKDDDINTEPSNGEANALEVDNESGQVRMLVEPDDNPDANLRRSKRSRVVTISDFFV